MDKYIGLSVVKVFGLFSNSFTISPGLNRFVLIHLNVYPYIYIYKYLFK